MDVIGTVLTTTGWAFAVFLLVTMAALPLVEWLGERR